MELPFFLHKALSSDQTDLNWRFMSTGRQYVYCIVEKQTGYSPFSLQNKLLVFDLWSGTRRYYKSSTSPDLVEFYETGENCGIAVMDDGSDISFHPVTIDHEHGRVDIGQSQLSLSKSPSATGIHRSSFGFSTRSATGVTMVIPFDGGISVIEMDKKCNVRKTAEDHPSSFFDDPNHPVCLVRTVHRNGRLWVTTEKAIENSVKIYVRDNNRWYELQCHIADTMFLVDVREDGNALVLNVEKHPEGHFQEDYVSFAVMNRCGVPSLRSIARKVALRCFADLRQNKHLCRIIGLNHS
ncbi:hypothetical protein NECAME_13132 [Necator americanus]|uniref:Uncharacterized protein n=1 Tax=Necator americanus TaxID=51031 RepID=W2SWR2_NECAM|nr:hypothetical protein NECAME_13132 [Necator americanus]ETN74204.1 hypothetical protein NECAME_13132 [Necator americanus]